MNGDFRLSAAAFRLNLDRPYLAAALWSLSRVPAVGLGTLAVDQFWRLYYDPKEVERLNLQELSGVLYHELCHLLRDHAARRPPDADPREWNIAADAEINDDLKSEDVVLPVGAIYPQQIRQAEGLLAEQYYENLPRGTDGIVAQLNPRCGSCATGVREQWEYGDDGGAQVPSPLSREEAIMIRDLVARTILQESRGTLPGHWRRWAEERQTAKVDWRRQLASIIRSSLAVMKGATDYSYRRPSRRQARGAQVIHPTLVGADPVVSVIVDTSGSMSDETQSMALAEISGILRACGRNLGVRVLAVDAAVQWSRRVFSTNQVELLGGGGTDVRQGFKAAMADVPRPDVIIVITDGHTPWPEAPPPGCRVIVLSTEPDAATPPWTRCVVLPSTD